MGIFKREKIPQQGDEIRAISMKGGTIRVFGSISELQTYNEENPEDRVRPIDPKHEE